MPSGDFFCQICNSYDCSSIHLNNVNLENAFFSHYISTKSLLKQFDIDYNKQFEGLFSETQNLLTNKNKSEVIINKNLEEIKSNKKLGKFLEDSVENKYGELGIGIRTTTDTTKNYDSNFIFDSLENIPEKILESVKFIYNKIDDSKPSNLHTFVIYKNFSTVVGFGTASISLTGGWFFDYHKENKLLLSKLSNLLYDNGLIPTGRFKK